MKYFLRSSLALSFLLVGQSIAVSAAPPTEVPPPKTISTPIPSIVTAAGEAYLPGVVQMLASAQVNDVILHPQGRYALIVQDEAAPPPGALMGKKTTGAATLLLYDARSHKTRILWERRADTAIHVIRAYWLPGTDCALAIGSDYAPVSESNSDMTNRTSVLFFNFEKSLNARTLLTTSESFTVYVSQTKPVYFLMSFLWPKSPKEKPTTLQLRRGNAQATLGAPLTVPISMYLSGFKADGTAIYGFEEVPVSPGAREQKLSRWFEWDGKSPALTFLPAQPAKATLEKKADPPVLPFAAHTTLPPVSLVSKVPGSVTTLPDAVLHPLYLKANDTPEDTPNHFVLIAPDADRSYLLADKSAVLYKSGEALYAVPLVHLSKGAFADVQKAPLKQAAMLNAKIIGTSIWMYAKDTQDTLPPAGIFNAAVTPYLKEASVLAGFTYVSPPGATLSSIEMPATIPMGYISVPGAGRAVLYVDGHVKWEDPK